LGDGLDDSWRVIGGAGDGPLQFRTPCQVWIADDDFVFVADTGNHRVQVLTPALDFHGFVGVELLHHPVGVCASTDIVVVSEGVHDRMSVFSRDDGTLLRRFGSCGRGAGDLHWPCGVCFMSHNRHVAVAEYHGNRVSVFGVDGAFIRHVGVGLLKHPQGVAASADDELVVADRGNRRIALLSTSGGLVLAFGRGDFSGVTMHRGAVFAQDCDELQNVVFE
jgi:DNA-binding beta-propeller fold protein YncE